MEPNTKSISGVLPSEVTASDTDGKHVLHAIITADIMDSDCEAMLSDGIDYTTRYQKNPVVLWDHNVDEPIGKCVSIKRNQGFIEATMELAKRPDTLPANIEWKPDTYYDMAKSGTLNAVSIGYVPKTTEWRKPTQGDIDRFGPLIKRVASKTELAEISLTGVPANMLTLVTEVKKAKGLGVKSAPVDPPAVVPPATVPLAELEAVKADLALAHKAIAELKAKAEAVPPVVVAGKSLQDQVTEAVEAQVGSKSLVAQVAAETDRQWALRHGKFFIPA